MTPPTLKSNFYTVRMTDGEQMNVRAKDMYTEHVWKAVGIVRILCSKMVETRSKGKVIAL